MVITVRYRIEQFLRAVTARRRISECRLERVTETLPPEAQALFAEQAPQDQRHALAVCETLRQRGYTSQDLLAAALLHDIGKAGAQLPPWQRGLFVLLERLAPRTLDRLVQGKADGWHGALAQYARHAETGARWTQAAGCSPLTVQLIRRHEEQLSRYHTEEEELLAALQAADDVN